MDRCHPLLSPTLKISDNLRGPQRLQVTVGMDIKILKSRILRIRRPVLYPLSYGCLTCFHIASGAQLQGGLRTASTSRPLRSWASLSRGHRDSTQDVAAPIPVDLSSARPDVIIDHRLATRGHRSALWRRRPCPSHCIENERVIESNLAQAIVPARASSVTAR